MKTSFIDTFFKWFFILSSFVYFFNTISLFSRNEPYFESLVSFLIESVAAVYFIKKSDFLWVKENGFFMIATITGLMMTKTFFFYYHGLDYQISAIISLFLVFSSYVAYKRYCEFH